jgi:hypothetical protein
MSAVSSHQRPQRALLQDRETLPGAALGMSRRRGLRIDDIVQRQSPPKRRRVEPANSRDKCNLQRFVVHVQYPAHDLRSFHSQRRQPNSDLDVLAKVRNAPADVAASGPLPRIILSRHGLLDGLAAIHNAPSTLSTPLPQIQLLNDRRALCPILEPAPLRPWRLVGNRLSLLVDMERTATEYVEDPVSSLTDNELRLKSYAHTLNEPTPSETITVQAECSTDYDPSPVPSISTYRAAELTDEGSLDYSPSPVLPIWALRHATKLADEGSPDYNPSPIPSVSPPPPMTH